MAELKPCPFCGNNMPAADVAPVVRCDGCKHARKSEDAFDWDGVTPLCECNYSRQPNRWHEYCSYGERKAGDSDAQKGKRQTGAQ